MSSNNTQPPQNPHASMVRADLLEALLENPGEVSPCKGGVKKDLHDKSELYACHDNPTPENTHWFANPDRLKTAIAAMNSHDLNSLKHTCEKFSERIEGNPIEVSICEAVSASPNIYRPQSVDAALKR